MIRTSAVLKFFLPQTSVLLQNAAKGWNSLGHLHLNLWAAELGIHYSPLNILASVLQCREEMRDRCMICDFTSFSTIFVLSERWAGDNERLCLRFERSPPQVGFETRNR